MTWDRRDKRRQQAAELRARAGRARNHARVLSDDPAGARLDEFAEELYAAAEAIEVDMPTSESDAATDNSSK